MLKKSGSSQVFQKLYSQESFPDIYKKKFDESIHDVAGDYADDPKKVMNLLKNRSYAELNIPGRAADFKSEVAWRMQLRN